METTNGDPARPPAMLVVGDGEVADALAAMARVMGWPCQLTVDLDAAVAALPDSDLVVVLSHHEGVDGPAIAAALDHRPAYLAAMGSRRTQARRREWLLANGVEERTLDAVHAPAGLDIGADAPPEIAVSILAEAVAVLRGVRPAGSISDRDGSIHPHLAPGTATCPGG